jgi:small conductance mechanosensitive channel
MPTDLLQGIADLLGVSAEEVTSVLAKKVGRLILIWVGAWVLFRVVKLLARRITAAVDDGDESRMSFQEKRGHTLAQLVRSVGKVVVLALAILLSLAEFINIGPLLAGAGIFGLAISFGAQSLVKDVISGFFILVENQFAVGDTIQIAGRTGVVERVTLRSVRLRDLEGVLHTVPCGVIDTVSNRTAGWSRAVVDIDVGYGEDVDRVLAVFRNETDRFAADPAWRPHLDGPPEVVGVERLGDSGVTIRTVLRTQPGQQWAAAREFRRCMKSRLDREGIEIPFPQRTVHLREVGEGRGPSRASEGS